MQHNASGARRMTTIGGTAEHLGVTTRTVRNWISQGVIPAYRIGGRTVRVDLNEVEAALRPIPAGNVG